jgi:hypothetical protein
MLARLIQCLAKPGSPQIVGQERTTLKARKRQLVHIGLLLKVLDLLSMRQSHADMLTSQAQPSTLISGSRPHGAFECTRTLVKDTADPKRLSSATRH